MLSIGEPVAARDYARQAAQLATAKGDVVLGRRIDALLESIVAGLPGAG